LRGYFLIITAMAIWSTWGLAIRWLGKPASVVTFYSALFALAFQGAVLYFVSRRQRLHFGRELATVLLLGACGLANVLSFFYALSVTTVASALLTHYTAPVFVAVFAPLVLKDRMSRATLAALAVSIAGLALIFARGLGIGGGAGLLGALAGTFSGVAYALVIIISRGISGRHFPLKLSLVQGLLTVAVLAFWVIPSPEAGLTLPQGMLFAVLGLAHSTLANAVYLFGIREVTAQEAGVLGYFEPFLAIILAFLFLGERPHVLAIAGGALIVLSGFIVVTQKKPADVGGYDDNRG